MKTGLIIGLMIAIVVGLGIAIYLVAAPPKGAGGGPGQPIMPDNNQIYGQSLSCPSRINVVSAVQTQGTPIKSDDEVRLTIMNPDNRSYQSKIYVDGFLEAEIALPAGSKTIIRSEQMTQWWRGGAAANPEDEPASPDLPSSRAFNIEVKVEGCENNIIVVTPDTPAPKPASAAENDSQPGEGGAVGGGSTGGGGGSAILKITRSTNQTTKD